MAALADRNAGMYDARMPNDEPNVWVVRADGGKYTEHCVSGGYTGIGWSELGDLSKIKDRDELRTRYEDIFPNDSPATVGIRVGQISRFLLDMSVGDWVITPTDNTEWLRYGRLGDGSPYDDASGDDGCPYRHRRSANWVEQPLRRSGLPVPLQNTLKSHGTVFSVSQRQSFLEAIGERVPPPRGGVPKHDPQRVVLEQILELSASEFEELVGSLLAAVGFDDSDVVGGPRDGGVDVEGTLNASNFAKVKVHVQAKRYKLGAKVKLDDVLKLRQKIPNGEQGTVITTADFPAKASDVALEQGFAHIGLINGSQLVDLLAEHWNKIPKEIRERLGLRPGLVRA